MKIPQHTTPREAIVSAMRGYRDDRAFVRDGLLELMDSFDAPTAAGAGP